MENNLKSTSGISAFFNGYKMCVSYNDNTCPYCGQRILRYEDQPFYGNYIKIRYICRNCGFICPVGYPNLKDAKPVYDSTINNFIDNFGSTIQDRIKDIIVGGIEI